MSRPDEDLLTVHGASRLAGQLGYVISSAGIRTAGDRGRLAVAEISGDGTRFYRRADVERFVRHRLQTSAPERKAEPL